MCKCSILRCIVDQCIKKKKYYDDMKVLYTPSIVDALREKV